MKILWHSVPPMIPSGYGTQTKLILPAIQKLGHEVAVSATVGMPSIMTWGDITIFPDSGHTGKFGMDVVKAHAERWKADLVISWIDAHALSPVPIKDLNWAAWVPVDSSPLMADNIKPLLSTKWQLGPTNWSVKMLNDAGFKDAMLLPCMHDPNIFFPMMGVAEAKAAFGKRINRDVRNKFLVNVVSCNAGGRKNFQAVFQAWKAFHPTCPDALLYLHTDMTGYFTGGSDLIQMAKAYGLGNDSVIFVSQYDYNTGQIGMDYLNLVYNASDVHLNCCYGEGFGLPIMEAQACGCPTIVPDFAAATEVGQCSKVKKGTLYGTVPGAMQFMVDTDSVVRALEEEYGRFLMGREDHRQRIHENTEPWQVENVAKNYLAPILKKIEGELK